jgi:hypothetical protein
LQYWKPLADGLSGGCRALQTVYVRRILRLAYLAPDVVLAIAEGRHPPTLVLQRLLAPIPLAWAEQRQTLGFTV